MNWTLLVYLRNKVEKLLKSEVDRRNWVKVTQSNHFTFMRNLIRAWVLRSADSRERIRLNVRAWRLQEILPLLKEYFLLFHRQFPFPPRNDNLPYKLNRENCLLRAAITDSQWRETNATLFPSCRSSRACTYTHTSLPLCPLKDPVRDFIWISESQPAFQLLLNQFPTSSFWIVIGGGEESW